jgi:Cu2+-containing amine oxidase
MKHHLWTTPYAPKERFSSGDWPNQNALLDDGLDVWASQVTITITITVTITVTVTVTIIITITITITVTCLPITYPTISH